MPGSVVSGIVTFTTDFGLDDGYAGAMKGALLKVFSEACIVDITHDIEPFDLTAGLLVLKSAFSYFPSGTVHVVVIDPGVGSCRLHVLVEAAGHFFIGPDNGILGGISALYNGSNYEIDSARLDTGSISNTFHGRDIYAQAAGHLLAQKGDHSHFTFPALGLETLEIPRPVRVGNELRGQIIYCDRFGNLVTNITPGDIPQNAEFFLGDRNIQLKKNYTELASGGPGIILNSWGFLEIAYRQQSASQVLSVAKGTTITVLERSD
jgi:S-adenosylmethionine hydrolase